MIEAVNHDKKLDDNNNVNNNVTQESMDQVTSAENQRQNSPPLSDLQPRRAERIYDYMKASLEKEDPLHAVLASANANLMSVGLHLDEAIQRALTGGAVTLERMQNLLPALDMNLRVNRQIDRFARIEIQDSLARKTAEKGSRRENGRRGMLQSEENAC